MTRFVAVLILGLATLYVLSESTYAVQEYEQVLVTQFGKIVSKPVTSPGLHFKVPLVQEIRRFDKRWLEWDGDPNQVPTKDKKYIWVDTYARWRIKDPIKFYERLRDEIGAQSRLDDIIDGEVRNVIASHDLIDIVRSSARAFERGEEPDETETDETEFIPALGRAKLTQLVLKDSSAVMPDYGIELADVQFKRLNYVDSVQEKVFERMISERKRIAQRYRSEGQGKAAEIEGKIDRELKTIQSEAYRQAEEIRGKADAEAAAIYAEAYNRNPDLYDFTKTLDAYRTVIDDKTDVVLSTKAEVLKYLRAQ